MKSKWILPLIIACAVLLAVTNVITFDVASAPFLWVLPLAVYLLCFVLTFKRRLWCPPVMRRILPWSVLVGVLVYVLAQFRLTIQHRRRPRSGPGEGARNRRAGRKFCQHDVCASAILYPRSDGRKAHAVDDRKVRKAALGCQGRDRQRPGHDLVLEQ